MTCYLVTGGSGFIGSHLVEAMLARGDRVIVLDDLSTGRLTNLDAVAGHRSLRIVEGSVLNERTVLDLVEECDVVVHMAAAVGVKLIVEAPLQSLRTNIAGSESVFSAAYHFGRPVLLTSTSEIYGKNGHGPLAEDSDRLLGPTSVARWSYSTSKAVDEILAFSYHQELGLPTTVVRLFNTVGRRQSPAYGMVIPRLVRQGVTGRPLTVFGDGRQTRCFCHVSDVVDALLRLLAEPRAVGGVFNIGSVEEISINGLAHRIADLTGNRSEVELVPYKEVYAGGFEDMRRRVPDISRIRALVGWEPTRSLTDILAETIVEAAAEEAAVPTGTG